MSEPNPKTLTITPASVTLSAANSQVFTIDPPGQKVTWRLLTDSSRDGIQEHGVYKAPNWIWRGRSLVLLATNEDENTAPAMAKIELCSANFWSVVVGVFWLLIALLLVWGLLTVWPRLRGFGPLSLVNPAAVTLPAKATQQFNAAGPGAPGNRSAIVWSINPEVGTISTGGLYRAPDEFSEQSVTVSATRDGMPLGSATILLRKNRTLTVSPSGALVLPSGKQTFTYTVADPYTAGLKPAAGTADKCDAVAGQGWNADPVWTVTPSAGRVDRNGTYEAPAVITHPQKVSVVITKQCDSAAASIYLSNDSSTASFDDPTELLIKFVMIMGALGSYVRAASSFVAFVGNRQFVTSWTWWYFLRPLIGGALAVIGYFLFGSGYIPAAGADTGNLLKIGAVAALIGLYEEQACVKLGEIFDSLFKPAEKGKDQLDTARSPSKAVAETAAAKTAT